MLNTDAAFVFSLDEIANHPLVTRDFPGTPDAITEAVENANAFPASFSETLLRRLLATNLLEELRTEPAIVDDAEVVRSYKTLAAMYVAVLS